MNVFFDSPSRLRSKILSTYKAARRQLDENEIADHLALRQQALDLKSLLSAVGIPWHQHDGYESDDLIASACLHLAQSSLVTAIIITADGDLFQSINESISWYDPSRKKYYDENAFVADKGIHPRWWGEVKAIAGCRTDNVEGIAGIGERSAVKYLKGQLTMLSSKRHSIDGADGQEMIRRNHRLVILPLKGTPNIKLVPPSWNWEGFLRKTGDVGIELDEYRQRQWRSIINSCLSVTDVQRRAARKRSL